MLSVIRKVALYLVSLLVGTGILANLARTSPEEAVENWQKWLRFLGAGSLTSWIKIDSLFVVGVTIGAVFAVAGMAGLFRAWWRQRDPFISLHEAATRAYQTFRKGGGIGKLAPHKLSENNPLSWCASFLLTKNIPVYGIHPPSRERERIPNVDLHHLHVEKDVTELHEIMSSRNPIWKDLQVRVDDLQPILEHIEQNYGD